MSGGVERRPSPFNIRVRPDDKLDLHDVQGMRRDYIAGLLRRNDAALAAFDALGEGVSPTIDPGVMLTLLQRAPEKIVNEFVGMTLRGPVRRAAARDRIVIYWLLYDMHWAAQVATRRIMMEQSGRTIAERSIAELRKTDNFRSRADSSIEETELSRGRRDALQRSPAGAHDHIVGMQGFLEQFRSPRPLWGDILGVPWRVGDTFIAAKEAGEQSALGAFAVILSGLVKRRHDDLVAKLACRVLGGAITAREIGRRRQVFLEQRGLSSSVRSNEGG